MLLFLRVVFSLVVRLFVIKKIILYVLVFFISLLLSLLILMPANILWEKILSPQLNVRQVGVDVQKVIGTIWNGQALIAYKDLSGIVTWKVEASELLMLSLPLKLKLDSQIGSLEGRVDISFESIDADLKKGQISLGPLSPFFRAERITLDGELFLNNLKVSVQNKQIKSASGLASWSGGEIAYPAGREVHQRNLPSFKAVLDTKSDGVVHLSIRDSQATFDVIDADLAEDGTAMLRITRRLLDLSEEPWSLNSKEQDIVFKVKKMLY